MWHARGVICLAGAKAGIPVIHYSATQIKKVLTGNGRAPKWQMQQAIERELALAAPPEPPDVADALAIALCHYHLNVRRVLAQKGGRMKAEGGMRGSSAVVFRIVLPADSASIVLALHANQVTLPVATRQP